MGPGIVPASNAPQVKSMDRNSFRNSLLDYTTADILNTPIQRGGVLPLTRYPGRTEFDLSSGITGAVADAFTAPSRAYSGEMSGADMIPEGFNFASNLMLGSLLSGAAAPAKNTAMSIYKSLGPEDAAADTLRTSRIAGMDRFMFDDPASGRYDSHATTFANKRMSAPTGDDLLDLLYGSGMGPANSNKATAELFANAGTGAVVPLARLLLGYDDGPIY